MNTLRSHFLAATAALLVATLVALNATATSVLPLDLDEIATGARDIVHVRCTGNEVQPDATIGVVTVTSFVVLDRAKGTGSTVFAIRQAGGELNGIAVDYHVPKFAVGSEYVLFMPPASRLGLASPVGLSQGAFSVVQGPAGKEVGNGIDFAELLSSADRVAASPNLRKRLQLPRPERGRVDLTEFMSMMRAKAGAK